MKPRNIGHTDYGDGASVGHVSTRRAAIVAFFLAAGLLYSMCCSAIRHMCFAGNPEFCRLMKDGCQMQEDVGVALYFMEDCSVNARAPSE